METVSPANDQQIIERILDGCSLRTVMVPDPELPSNRPEHVESYDLPHVVISGTTFWAKSRSSHLFHLVGEADMGRVAFCYTNAGDHFCSFNDTNNKGVAFSRFRYKKHRWHLAKNYRLIWDSENNEPADALRIEIEKPSTFKIAMLDSEDVWNVHPVDLPMYEVEQGVFRLKTNYDFYPAFFRNSNGADVLTSLRSEAVEESVRALNVSFETPPFCSFYSVCSDGSYYNYYDIPRSTQQNYVRLKVFSDDV